MNDTPKRRLLDRMRGTPSLLSEHSRLVGDIETPDALVVGGSVQGDGNVGGELALGAGAHWQGEVRARSAVIAGRITGAVVVAERIEIAASAVIQGAVNARSIAMARGARVEGQVTVTSGEAIVEFDEKRRPGSI